MSVVDGVDVSGWQHPNDQPINWPAVAKAGKRFAIVKATQAQTWVNPWLHEDATEASKAGLKVGVYHYAVPAEGDAVIQAAYFVAATQGLLVDLGWWLDLETPGSLPRYLVSNWAREFLDYVKAAVGSAGIYLNDDYITQLAWNTAEYPLWLSFSDIPQGVHPEIHQGLPISVPGISGQVDSDVLLSYRGLDPGSSGPQPIGDDDVGAIAKEGGTKGPWYVIGGVPVVKAELSVAELAALPAFGYREYPDASKADLDAIPTVPVGETPAEKPAEAAVAPLEPPKAEAGTTEPTSASTAPEAADEPPPVDPTSPAPQPDGGSGGGDGSTPSTSETEPPAPES